MTADRSAAADTLRDELATISNPATRQRLLDAAFRYADAREAAVRERIAAEIEAVVPIARRDMGPVGAKIQAYAEAARIARGQP